MSKYPEHEKLKAVKHQSQAIGNFIEWMGSKGFHFAKYETIEDDHIIWNRRSIATLLADYFEIDLKKLENEKQSMIEDMRKLNATNN